MKTRLMNLVLLIPLVALGCTDETPSEPTEISAEGTPADVGETKEALTYYPDTALDPLPTTSDLISPNGIATIYPGARGCYPPLSANQSAGIAGYFAFSGLTKYPKLQIFWQRNSSSTQSKIYGGDIIPDASGFFSKVLNTGNGNAAYFPGIFQFCLRNPGVNRYPFQTNASVVTF